LGAADEQARRYLIGQARKMGLRAVVDPAGNLLVGRGNAVPGRPVLLFGSHADTVVHGGRYDGAYGVVAALEVLAAVAGCAGPLAYEPVAVAFTNEEGAGFPYPFLGSKAVVGAVEDPEAITDRDGRTLRAALARCGGDIDAFPAAAWPAGRLGAFLELHVEQGPLLERAGIPVGIVDVITGRYVFDIALYGRQGHAGTTPMDLRSDAVVAAAQVVLAIEDLAKERHVCRVATVGVVDVVPNMVNVVPGTVHLSAEVRDVSADRLRRAEQAVLDIVGGLGDDIAVEVTVSMRTEPVATDGRMRDCIRAAADELGIPSMSLSSGAGHDAQIIAGLGPVGVIFVPSRDGLSHAPGEHTEARHLVAGANVLLRTVARLLAVQDVS
jgi:N-carbamoyl-L-amino-acid hydrolase